MEIINPPFVGQQELNCFCSPSIWWFLLLFTSKQYRLIAALNCVPYHNSTQWTQLEIQMSGIVNSKKLEKSLSTTSGRSIDVQTALPEAALGLRTGGLVTFVLFVTVFWYDMMLFVELRLLWNCNITAFVL